MEENSESFQVNESAPEYIKSEITNLEIAVNSFDYSQLRAISKENVSEQEEKVCWASIAAVEKLYSMFSETFIFSDDQRVSKYFKNLKNQPLTEIKLVIQLADILLTFKTKIEEAELVYFQSKFPGDVETAKMSATLASGDRWLSVFQFMIEQRYDLSMFSQKYKPFIDNLKQLTENTCLFLAKHAPNHLGAYEKLMSEQDIKIKLEGRRKARASEYAMDLNLFEPAERDPSQSGLSKRKRALEIGAKSLFGEINEVQPVNLDQPQGGKVSELSESKGKTQGRRPPKRNRTLFFGVKKYKDEEEEKEDKEDNLEEQDSKKPPKPPPSSST